MQAFEDSGDILEGFASCSVEPILVHCDFGKVLSESAVSKTLDIILENVQAMKQGNKVLECVPVYLCRLASCICRLRDRIFTPVFVLMHHTEEKRWLSFSSIWAEGAPSDAAALRLYH